MTQRLYENCCAEGDSPILLRRQNLIGWKGKIGTVPPFSDSLSDCRELWRFQARLLRTEGSVMRRLICGAITLLALVAPKLLFAQGVLINVNVNEHVALPRPIVIHTPRPIPL